MDEEGDLDGAFARALDATTLHEIKDALQVDTAYATKPQLKHVVRKLNSMQKRWQRVCKSNSRYIRFMCRARYRAVSQQGPGRTATSASASAGVCVCVAMLGPLPSFLR